jgi:hypothetical protein
MKLLKIGDLSKFSFSEMTSNNNGKTSATSTAGIYIIAIGGICFLLGCIDKMFLDKSADIINQAVVFTSIGAALLGVKNVMNRAKDVESVADATPAEPEQLNS